MANSPQIYCSFCHKTAKDVKTLIGGDSDNYICEECIEKCSELLKQTKAEKKITAKKKISKSPRIIKEFLDQYVVGQNHAKEVISIAVYNHYKRLEHKVSDDEIEITKANICLIGNSGSGKTFLAKTVAKYLEVPFVSCDVTSLTEAGYVGDDVESVITRLLQAADGDIKKAETGIVFLDEICKKRSKEGNASSKDVSGEGVQQALLKLLEGTEIIVPSGNRKGPNADTVKINTQNILFILGGAFVGIDEMMEETTGIGFGATVDKTKPKKTRQIEPEHLIKFGLIPELIGRIPVIATLDTLSEDQLFQILSEPKNSLVKQFTKMFSIDGVNLEFEDAALREIAKIAILRKTGGRALRSVLETKMHKIQYNLPDLRDKGAKTIIVTASSITDNADPMVIYNKKTKNKNV